MVKLIVTDVDDTLVPEAGSEINPEYYDIIRECRKRGIIFGVASGRQKPCVRKLFEPVLDEIFILADNSETGVLHPFSVSLKLRMPVQESRTQLKASVLRLHLILFFSA